MDLSKKPETKSAQKPQPIAWKCTNDGKHWVTSKELRGHILPCGSYVKIGDMTWPSFDQGELEWQLRYGSDEQAISAKTKLASIVSAYKELLSMTQKRRNEICAAIREAT